MNEDFAKKRLGICLLTGPSAHNALALDGQFLNKPHPLTDWQKIEVLGWGPTML